MNVLFLIVARGGSKGIPGKNLRRVAGIPLVGWKALAARRAKSCRRLIISTDSAKIQAVARRFGAEVPFRRPRKLATDAAGTMDVIRHAMSWLEKEGRRLPDAIMLLEPSSPFTRPSDYDQAVALMSRKKADVVLGVRRMEVASRFVGPMEKDGKLTRLVRKIASQKKLRRQESGAEYTPNGALYLFRWDYFKKHRSLYANRGKVFGYLMDRLHSLEIDEPEDLALAEGFVKQGAIDLGNWKGRRK